ncbi:MAG: hypothetical protein FJ217_11955 [Ignavibacteria bacterium]|nr:hypothetical protein [Ignavibacteria bacterium]
MANPGMFLSRVVKVLRWIARGLSALIAAFLFLLAVGEGLNPATLTLEEAVMMLGFLASWLGFIVGWKLEGVGGILIIGGLLWHCLFEFLFRGTMFLGIWVVVPALPGILFLLCWWGMRRLRRSAVEPVTPAPP